MEKLNRINTNKIKSEYNKSRNEEMKNKKRNAK